MSADRTSWLIMAAVFGTAITLIVIGCLTPAGDWLVNLP